MGNDFWTVRHYEAAADLPMIESWWTAHRDGRFPAEILPPIGIIALRDGKPMAALWLYMAVGVGVCWVEYPVSKPGLSMGQARDAFDCALGAVIEIARTHDYHGMVVNTTKAIARHLQRSHGFTLNPELVTLERMI